MYFIELIKQSRGMTLELVIWALYFGILIACALAIYEKRVIGRFVRTLLKREALTPDTAVALCDIGYEKNGFIHSALRGKTALSGIVFLKDEELRFGEDGSILPAIRGKVDYRSKDVRFYIPEPLRYRASVRFEQKGTHIMGLVVAAILFAILAYLLSAHLPTLLGFAEEFLTSL